ncbi:hypothetical protein RYZ20_03455 [Thioclava sp. A2]|uniref:Flp family type IVb pilin n=1 Tax=Thioclava sp. FCG-A2 TaxID=3080562 RepID=UPI0029555722|nr:hypothetical protein [Thioclava sp. A2]MDV7269952.1 hypothetical protein [Thioclava sp. A2]
MKNFVLKNLSRIRKDEEGVTLVEYGIALALAVTLGTAALNTLATEVGGSMTAAGTVMPN